MCHRETCINKLMSQSPFSLLKLTRPERPVHTQIHPSETRASLFRQCYFLVSHTESVKETQTARRGGEKKKQKTTKRTEMFWGCFWVLVFFLSAVTCYVCVPVLLKASHTSAGSYIWGSIYTDRISDYFYTLCGTNLMFSWLTTSKSNITVSNFSLFTVTNRSGLLQRWGENIFFWFSCKGSFSLCLLFVKSNFWTYFDLPGQL